MAIKYRAGVSLATTLLASALLAIVWIALFAFIRHDKERVGETAYAQSENYAIAFEEYAHNIILNVDNSLLYLRQAYARSQAGGPAFNDLLLAGYAPIKTFQFSVVGPDGILRYSNLAPASSRVDLSDREHIRVHMGTTEDKLFISRPILGRVSGKWSIQFTRKIVLADGSFGGVLVLSVERREFEDFFERVNVGEHGLIALLGYDGWMRARGTRVPETIRDIASEPLPPDRPYLQPGAAESGRLDTIGHYDGISRMGAYRKVRDEPFLVAVQFARDEVFAEHNRRVDRIVAIGLILSTAVVLSLAVVAVLRQQRDAAVHAVAESEQRWRLALDSVGDGVLDWNLAQGTFFFSPQMQVISGTSAKGLPRTLPEWLEQVHPDDREGVAEDFQVFLRGNRTFYHEYRLRRGDGSYVWVQDRAAMAARLQSGRPLRVIGLRSDISQRRQLQDELAARDAEMRALQAALAAREIDVARHRLSEAQRLARLGIVERTADPGRWQACEHGSALLGLAPAASYSLDELFTNVALPGRAAAIALLAAADPSAVLELAVEVGGETRYLRAVGSAPATPDEHAFVTLQDISARRASEIEHARLKERMEEASRMESLGTLAGGIAHEINTPAQFVGDNLSFLHGSVASLLAIAEASAAGDAERVRRLLDQTDLDFLGKEMPEAIDQGLEGVGRIAKIVQAVKEFCYPSSRNPQPCDLNHMIESAATVTRNAWKYCAELELDLASPLPHIDAIEGELNQVLINLIVNAAQAIEEGHDDAPGRITIRTWDDGNTVCLSVADTGIGIPADRHKRIFELFYTTKPPGQGTGQGLAISSAIVRRHGGSIAVASQPGQGACFTISLPKGRQ